MTLLQSLDHGDKGPHIVILHGLLGTARNWNSIARRLAGRGQVHCLDMRNHGQSFHDPVMDYPAMAGDIAAYIDQVCDGSALVVGHSMGGKAAMTLALSQPEKLAGLAVIDIAPHRYKHSYTELLAGMQAIDLATVSSRSDVQKQLAPLTGNDAGMTAFLLQNLAREGDSFVWRPNLRVLEAAMDAIIGFPATDAPVSPAPVYDRPTLFAHGGNSKYVQDARDGETIRGFFPRARLARIAGAGHWVHAEKPDEVTALLQEWMDEVAEDAA